MRVRNNILPLHSYRNLDFKHIHIDFVYIRVDVFIVSVNKVTYEYSIVKYGLNNLD